jgi:hypothetical protein
MNIDAHTTGIADFERRKNTSDGTTQEEYLDRYQGTFEVSRKITWEWAPGIRMAEEKITDLKVYLNGDMVFTRETCMGARQYPNLTLYEGLTLYEENWLSCCFGGFYDMDLKDSRYINKSGIFD